MGLISFVLIPSWHHLLQSVGESLKPPTALDQCRSKCDSSLIRWGIVIAVLRRLCNSSVRTQSSLPENFIFYFVSAISVPAVVAAEGYIFILRPGQLQSDTTRVQIVHSFQTRARFAVILLAPCALWIRRWDGADSGGKWNAIFGVESGRSSILENQYLCFSHSAI